MDIFTSLLNNWSMYEKLSLTGIFVGMFLVILIATQVLTQNKKLILWFSLSLLSSALLTTLALWLLNIIFDITITSLFLFTPFVILCVNILSLGSSFGYYMRHFKSKGFNLISLQKEFLRDSFQLSIFLLLLFSSLSVFLSSTYLTFTLATGTISILMVWINYALMYRIVR